MSEFWSPVEEGVLKICNSRKDAKQKYLEKFPDSLRAPATVARRFYDLRPECREPLWSDEEKAPFQVAETVEGAIGAYRNLFPNSHRSDAAVRRKWYELRPEKHGLVPCGRKKGGRNKAPRPGTAREKYGIPMSTKQDAKAYNHAVYICTKFDKPYPEALELEKSRPLRGVLKRTAKSREKPTRKILTAAPRKLKIRPGEPPAAAKVPEPQPQMCSRCHSIILPMDFLYTEKSGLCIPCWEAQEVGEAVL
jgi:hypothetical protein